MPSIAYVVEYFTSPSALIVLGTLVTLSVASYLGFRLVARTSVRIALLAVIFGASISLWIFVASSLVFCEVYDYLYPPEMMYAEVKVVFGWATMFTLGLGLPLTALVSLRGARALVGGLSVTDPPLALRDAFNEVKAAMGTGDVALVTVRAKHLTCFSVGLRERVVVVSEDLAKALSPQELRSILAHEMAHIQHGDAKLKSLLGVYSRILRFDPILRLVKAAVQREMECRADERVARSMGGPSALISALSKLERLGRHPRAEPPSYASQLLASHPPMHVRIARLRRLGLG